MSAFAQLEQRIEALCARAASGPADPGLVLEIEDLLAEGFLRALEGDRRSRSLGARSRALVAGARTDDLEVVIREQALVGEATRQLRSRLAVMHELWAGLRASC